MTTDDIRAAEGRIAQMLLETDDHLEALHEIRPVLTPPTFTAVCQMLEVCEVHGHDDAICRDDDLDCPANGHPADA